MSKHTLSSPGPTELVRVLTKTTPSLLEKFKRGSRYALCALLGARRPGSLLTVVPRPLGVCRRPPCPYVRRLPRLKLVRWKVTLGIRRLIQVSREWRVHARWRRQRGKFGHQGVITVIHPRVLDFLLWWDTTHLTQDPFRTTTPSPSVQDTSSLSTPVFLLLVAGAWTCSQCSEPRRPLDVPSKAGGVQPPSPISKVWSVNHSLSRKRLDVTHEDLRQWPKTTRHFDFDYRSVPSSLYL